MNKRVKLFIKRGLIGIFLLCLFFTCFADETSVIKVKAAVDNSEITVGDKIKYEIKIECRKDVEVTVPGLEDDLTSIDIVDSGRNEQGILGNKKINYWYYLENFNTENFVIPKVAVKYKKQDDKDWHVIETDEINIKVKSLLTSQDNDIKDIKYPVALKSNLFLLFLLIGVITIFGLWLFLYKRYFLKKKEGIFLKEPAHITALRKLNLLKNKNFLQSGRIEEYYVELSSIVRFYIEERFNIRAPEMTTEEFLYNLKGQTALNSEQKSALRDFLSSTDKVKFARFQPQTREIEESFNIAYKFIEDTKEADINYH